MPDAYSLHGKVAVITGAGGDLGGAASVMMAEAGAAIVAVDRRGEMLEALEARMPDGARFLAQTADVTREADVAGYVQAAKDAFGRIDIFFNNAGVEGSRTGAFARATELSKGDFEEIMAVNATGVFLGLKHVIPVMIAGGGGAIVNTSSINGLKGSRGQIAYVASKHAVTAMTATCAKEFAGQNIRVNAIAPGGIDGRMMRDYMQIVRSSLPPEPAAAPPTRNQGPPQPRWADPREIAALAVFLASDRASYLTGHTYSVDGGLIAM